MGFTPPAAWVETATQLKTSGVCTLGASGLGVISVSPTSANMRWVLDSVIVTNSQPGAANPVPWATLALNTTVFSQMSQGNQRGTTISSNSCTFSGSIDVGPCDFLSVLFYPAPGTSGAGFSGVTCAAVFTGTRYTRTG
jgi:hypothetical protein